MNPLPKEYKKEREMPMWYAMRATYRCEIKTRDELTDAGIKCFLPLLIQEKTLGGRLVRTYKPAISSLIFVYATKGDIQAFKKDKPRLQYLCRRRLDKHTAVPITVPEAQMETFIAICKSNNFELSEATTDFKPGMPIRVTSGPFAGMRGTFQRVKGHRDRRFVVNIEGVARISTEMSPDMIEPFVEIPTGPIDKPLE